MVKSYRARNRFRGGTETEAPAPSGGSIAPAPTQSFKAAPGKTGTKMLLNPHTTMALLICVIVFISMWTIFSMAPYDNEAEQTKSFMLYEIAMSVMSMTAAASGLAYFLLQGELPGEDKGAEGNFLIWGFPILAGLSFISWGYFAYGARNVKDDGTTS